MTAWCDKWVIRPAVGGTTGVPRRPKRRGPRGSQAAEWNAAALKRGTRSGQARQHRFLPGWHSLLQTPLPHPPEADIVVHLGAQASKVGLDRRQLSARRQRDDDRLCSTRPAGLNSHNRSNEDASIQGRIWSGQLEGGPRLSLCLMAAAAAHGGRCSERKRVCPLATGCVRPRPYPISEIFGSSLAR